MLIFEEGRRPESPEKNPRSKGRRVEYDTRSCFLLDLSQLTNCSLKKTEETDLIACTILWNLYSKTAHFKLFWTVIAAVGISSSVVKPKYQFQYINCARARINNKTQPTYDAGSGNRARDTLVEGGRSHHCATPAPHFIIFDIIIFDKLTYLLWATIFLLACSQG